MFLSYSNASGKAGIPKLEGGYMGYLEDDLFLILQILAYSDWLGEQAKDVLDKVEDYKTVLSTFMPVVAKRKVHIIGMEHGGNDPNLDASAITSQIKVTNLLKSLRPDIVGLEGFWAEDFSVYNYAVGCLELRGYKPEDLDPKLLDQYVAEVSKHPAGNSIFRYADFNSTAKVMAVEYRELMRLQLHLNDLVQKNGRPEKLMQLYMAVARLRGILMMARLGEHLSNESLTTSIAIPVGYLHLQEITELRQALQAPWKFYNTTGHTQIDLPR